MLGLEDSRGRRLVLIKVGKVLLNDDNGIKENVVFLSVRFSINLWFLSSVACDSFNLNRAKSKDTSWHELEQ